MKLIYLQDINNEDDIEIFYKYIRENKICQNEVEIYINDNYIFVSNVLKKENKIICNFLYFY